ncbi:MAG: hypothetical protein ACRDTC_02605 [Pseudonocardiaceae bacterium]
MLQHNQQAGALEPTPPGQLRHHRRLDRMITDWHTTPGKLRMTMMALVIGVLFSGGVGTYAAYARAEATRDLAERIEPLNASVTTLYRSLAAADATVTSGFLSGSLEPNEIRNRYDEQVTRATANLTQAGAQAGEDMVTADRIADIAAQLPVYTGLIERARANNRQGLPLGVAYLERASALMQTSILPMAEELQRRQATQLDNAYQRAAAVPILALTASAVSLSGLIWAQLFLFQRTHRIFNIGLLAATGTVLAGLLWWTVAGMISTDYLQGSFGHSQSMSDALGPAQIAAQQARAIESLGLVARDGETTENDFGAQMQLLARARPAVVGGTEVVGGALGAARRFATDQEGQVLVKAAIDEALGYREAHQQVRRLDADGQYDQAVATALSTPTSDPLDCPLTEDTTFGRLDCALTEAFDYERAAFKGDIDQAHGWLAGLALGTGALALAAAAGVVMGIRSRLEEYR